MKKAKWAIFMVLHCTTFFWTNCIKYSDIKKVEKVVVLGACVAGACYIAYHEFAYYHGLLNYHRIAKQREDNIIERLNNKMIPNPDLQVTVRESRYLQQLKLQNEKIKKYAIVTNFLCNIGIVR